MPFRDPAQHFKDILEYIAHIEDVLSGLDYQAYVDDRKTSAAIERFLQIVTEAAYRLRDDAERLCPGPDWRRWRDLGNILRHAYERVDPSLIWGIVHKDLPQLKSSVQDALRRLELDNS